MPIKIEITADNETQLLSMVATLSGMLAQQGVKATPVQNPSKGGVRAQAVVSVEPMDMGDEEAPTGDETDAETEAAPAEEKRGRGRPKGSTNKPPAVEVDFAKMRDEAIKWATDVFTKGATEAEAVRALTKKFSVRKLAEVPDAQVPELHAEAFKLKEQFA